MSENENGMYYLKCLYLLLTVKGPFPSDTFRAETDVVDINGTVWGTVHIYVQGILGVSVDNLADVNGPPCDGDEEVPVFC